MKKISILMALFLILSSFAPSYASTGLKEGTASLFLPTTGQAMNGQLGNTKTKVMGVVEVAAVTTVAVIGVATGGAAVWWGLAPLLGNHLYSSADAYKNARNKQNQDYVIQQQQMQDAQRSIDLSRQNRYDREQTYRSDIHERVARAGEMAAYQ